MDVDDLDGFLSSYYKSRGISINSAAELAAYGELEFADALSRAKTVSSDNIKRYCDKHLQGQPSIYELTQQKKLAFTKGCAARLEKQSSHLGQPLARRLQRVDSLPRKDQPSTSLPKDKSKDASNSMPASTPAPTPAPAPTPTPAPAPELPSENASSPVVAEMRRDSPQTSFHYGGTNPLLARRSQLLAARPLHRAPLSSQPVRPSPLSQLNGAQPSATKPPAARPPVAKPPQPPPIPEPPADADGDDGNSDDDNEFDFTLPQAEPAPAKDNEPQPSAEKDTQKRRSFARGAAGEAEVLVGKRSRQSALPPTELPQASAEKSEKPTREPSGDPKPHKFPR